MATGPPSPSGIGATPTNLPGHLAGRVFPALLASPLLFCCCCDVYVLKLAWPPEVSDSVPLPLPEVSFDGNPHAPRTDYASTSLNHSKHAKNRLFPGQIIPPKLSPESSHSRLLQLASQTRVHRTTTYDVSSFAHHYTFTPPRVPLEDTRFLFRRVFFLSNGACVGEGERRGKHLEESLRKQERERERGWNE